MAIKDFVKRKREQLESFREQRASKQRLKTQVQAEQQTRKLEAQAVRDEKLLGRLERQAKAKKTIDKVTKLQEKVKSPSKFGGFTKSIGGLQKKARDSGIGQGSMFESSNPIGGGLFGKPKRKGKGTKKKSKSVFDIGF